MDRPQDVDVYPGGVSMMISRVVCESVPGAWCNSPRASGVESFCSQ
jgi:hypothetical protein